MRYNSSGIGLPCAREAEKSSIDPMVGTRSVDSIARSNTNPGRTPRAQSHHPGGARERVAGAMMLKSVASGIVVGVASEIRQDEQRRVAGVFRFGLDRLPELRAQTRSVRRMPSM